MIRIPDNHLTDYLLASLGYSGTDRWHALLSPDEGEEGLFQEAAALIGKGTNAYLRAVGSGTPHVPFFLVMDLRLLAEFGFEFTYTEREIEGFDPMLRARYENEILNRLLREHRVQQAMELLAFHRARGAESAGVNTAFDLRAERLAHILLSRLAPHWPQQFIVNAAHMRGRTIEPESWGNLTEAMARWTESSQSLNAEAPSLEDMLDEFIHSATGSKGGVVPVSWVKAVETQDLFELEHIEALDRDYLRLGVRHIIDVMESLPELDPHDIELHEEINEVESKFMDDSYYPTGGFSEITNRGSFENLVLSELIYMGEGATAPDDEPEEASEEPSTTTRRGIDLFDLRFVEGELLFYTRDSGQLYRKRRMLRLIIDMRRTLNIKYPEHPYQLGTMVAGLVLALVRDLSLLFNNDALLFHVHLLSGREERDAQKLAETLTILLQSPIQHGALEISVQPNITLRELGSHTRKTYGLFFTSEPRAVKQLSGMVDELRNGNPPLFPTIIDLSAKAGEDLDQDHVLRLELSERALGDLKHDILLDIMHSRQRRRRTTEDDEAA